MSTEQNIAAFRKLIEVGFTRGDLSALGRKFEHVSRALTRQLRPGPSAPA